MSQLGPTTLKFLRKEAKRAFAALPYGEKMRYGSYKGLLMVMKSGWLHGNQLPIEVIRGFNERKKHIA